MTACRSPTRIVALAVALLAACGGGATGSGGDSGPVDVTGGPITPGDPITVTAAETWEWKEIAGTACGNGSVTGIGVNLTTVSDDVVIYLQGGGACWDALSCFGIPGLFPPAASNLDGYGATQLATEPVLGAELFRRDLASNPFLDASWVFVPYCTGDLHSGDEVHTYGTSGTISHTGARNLERILPRLAATFPGLRRVYVAGSSAGGFGVQLRFHRFVAAFPEADLHGLADGAQAVQPQNGLVPLAIGAWSLQLPPGCRACATSFPALADHLAATWPDHRLGLTASTEDEVLLQFFGYTAADYAIATRALLASPAYQSSPAQRFFARNTFEHTMLGDLAVMNDAGTLSLREWVIEWRDGSATWGNEVPAP